MKIHTVLAALASLTAAQVFAANLLESDGLVTEKTKGWRFEASNAKNGATFNPLEGWYPDKGGKLISPRVAVPKTSAYYAVSFTGSAPARSFEAIAFYDKAGNMVADNYDVVYPNVTNRYERFFYVQEGVSEIEVFFQSPKGCTVSDVKIRPATVEEAAAWCDSVAAKLPPINFWPIGDAFKSAPKTLEALKTGRPIRILMLGDSIIQDTFHSQFHALMKRAYPKSEVTWMSSVRGSTGCRYYRIPENFEQYVTAYKADCVIVGGISNWHAPEEKLPVWGNAAIYEVCEKIRAAGMELIVVSPTLSVDTRMKEYSREFTPLKPRTYDAGAEREALSFTIDKYIKDRPSGLSPEGLKELGEECARRGWGYIDAFTPAYRWLYASGMPWSWHSRDYVHSGELGKQVIARIMMANLAPAEQYEATWESLDKRPVAEWWKDAKFGIFIHWGPYAVPAYAPVRDDGKFDWDGYAEWYQGKMNAGKEAFVKHHAEKYHNAPYGNFAAEFKARYYNPSEWAKLFKKAGAKYVVLTSKHHDGYALWPSPEQPYYNAKTVGSGRDLARAFCNAMRAEGLKRGFYFSMLEYANPLYPGIRDSKRTSASLDIGEWNRRVNIPQLKELVNDYEADIIWPDGEWDYTSDEHGDREFLAWLFNESKMKDTVVINDRWGKECRGRHGGHYTTEYALEGGDTSGSSDTHPWEECRGIGSSFGYNAAETPIHYMTRERCIETLVSCVSRGGNLLLNVGPDADGRIPAIQQDRLLAMGAWLEVNGEAIYGTHAWKDADPNRRSVRIYFTEKANAVYMFVFDWPQDGLFVDKLGGVKKVTMLGLDRELPFKTEGTGVKADTSSVTPADLPGAAPWVFKFER